MTHWFPWLIAAGNITSIYLTGRGKVAGFVVLIPTQLAFVIYALFTHQDGFVLQNVVMALMAGRGWYKWVKDGVHRDGRRSREKVSSVAE